MPSKPGSRRQGDKQDSSPAVSGQTTRSGAAESGHPGVDDPRHASPSRSGQRASGVQQEENTRARGRNEEQPGGVGNEERLSQTGPRADAEDGFAGVKETFGVSDASRQSPEEDNISQIDDELDRRLSEEKENREFEADDEDWPGVPDNGEERS
jgi:hypothetical protein